MTWKEFKKCLAEKGVRDNSEIRCIEVKYSSLEDLEVIVIPLSATKSEFYVYQYEDPPTYEDLAG